MNIERSYAKESYKTKPFGIRFNIEQERIAMMRSKKKTRQQLVDFLLENYVKGDVPTLNRQSDIPNAPNDTYKPPPEIRKPPQQWVIEKREIPDGDMDAYTKWFKSLEACSYLSTLQKSQIKAA